MKVPIEFWSSSDGQYDAKAEFQKACNDFPEQEELFKDALKKIASDAAKSELSKGSIKLLTLLWRVCLCSSEEADRKILEELEGPVRDLLNKQSENSEVHEIDARIRQLSKNPHPMREILEKLLRIFVKRPANTAAFEAVVTFPENGFQYFITYKFDVVREASKVRVIVWCVEA